MKLRPSLPARRPAAGTTPTAVAPRTAVLAAATLLAALVAPTLAGAAPLLLISLDGLRPADVLDAKERGLDLPNLRRFVSAGSYATAVEPVTPSLTYPNHTTLITGVDPARHGIINNLTFDPFAKNDRGWYWYSEDIKVSTLWDAAAARGYTTANVHWPVSVGAHIDYNLPQWWHTGMADDAKLLRAVGTPGLQAGLEAQLGPYADGIDESLAGDENRARFAVRLLQERKPWFTTAYFTALDHNQHEFGPDSTEAKAVLTRLDALVGRVVAAARAAHPDVIVALVSDHGFLKVEKDVNLYGAFIKAGLITLDGSKVKGWDAVPWFGGGSAAVVLRDPADAAVRERVHALLKALKADPANGIAAVLDRDAVAALNANPQADYWINFLPGWEMGTDPTAPLVAPSKLKGMHGFDSSLPEMQATFLLMGPGIPAGHDLGRIRMRDIAPTLAHRLDVSLPQAQGRDLLP